MSCINCKHCKWNIIMPCAVCVEVDKDSTPKKTCHCGICSAYICKKHWNDAPKRTWAAAKIIVKKVKKVFKKTDAEAAA